MALSRWRGHHDGNRATPAGPGLPPGLDIPFGTVQLLCSGVFGTDWLAGLEPGAEPARGCWDGAGGSRRDLVDGGASCWPSADSHAIQSLLASPGRLVLRVADK